MSWSLPGGGRKADARNPRSSHGTRLIFVMRPSDAAPRYLRVGWRSGPPEGCGPRKHGARMRILVTGGTGVVGRAAVTALREHGHAVRLMSRHAEGEIRQ